MNKHRYSMPTAYEIKDRIMGRVNRHIEKREMVQIDTGRHILNHMSGLIDEMNREVPTGEVKHGIKRVPDHKTPKADSMMPVPDSHIINSERLWQKERQELAQQLRAQRPHKRRRAMTKINIETLPFEHFSRSITPTPPKHFDVIPLQLPSEEDEDRQIEIFRMGKLQDWEKEKQQQEKQAKKKKLIIDLTGQRVMFDYESKIIKLDQPKQKDNVRVREVAARPQVGAYDYKRSALIVREINKTRHCTVGETSNITRVEEAEKQVKRKRHYSKIEEEIFDTYNPHVKVNLDSHKEVMSAMNVTQEGIRVTVNRREYSCDRATPRKMTTINRRISPAEYKQYKMDQAVKFEQQKRKSLLKKDKLAAEASKKAEEEKRQQEEREKERKLSFSLGRRKQSYTGSSRIDVFDERGRTFLIQQVKLKPEYLQTEPTIPTHEETRESMSQIDRYNLLYVRYNGHPPSPDYRARSTLSPQHADPEETNNQIDPQELAKQLRLQSVLRAATQPKASVYNSRKQNWIKDNRKASKK